MNSAAKTKKSEIEDVLRGIVIPSPPQVIADLQMEMAMPDPDLNVMANLIAKDVGLSGAVIKTVNSPIYRGSRAIDSINQGVMVLGMKTIMDIINTLCLRNTSASLDKMTDNIYKTLTRFWDSASDMANVCELIGRKLGLSPIDNVYLLGLFHNVGIALMISKHDDYLDVMVESYSQNGARIVDIENKVYDTNHAVISYYTAKSWKVDPRISKIISAHHNIDIFSKGNAKDTVENQLLGILKIAEHVVGLHRILGNQEKDYEWEKIGNQVLLLVGLTTYELDDIASQAEELGYGQQLYFR